MRAKKLFSPLEHRILEASFYIFSEKCQNIKNMAFFCRNVFLPKLPVKKIFLVEWCHSVCSTYFFLKTCSRIFKLYQKIFSTQHRCYFLIQQLLENWNKVWLSQHDNRNSWNKRDNRESWNECDNRDSWDGRDDRRANNFCRREPPELTLKFRNANPVLCLKYPYLKHSLIAH